MERGLDRTSWKGRTLWEDKIDERRLKKEKKDKKKPDFYIETLDLPDEVRTTSGCHQI